VSEDRRLATNREDIERLARAGTEWLLGIAGRVVGLAKVVMIVSFALGALAVALGILAIDGDARIVYVVLAVLVCFIPAAIAWFLHNGLSTVVHGGPQLVRDLNSAVRDPATRQTLIEAMTETETDRRRSRVGRGRRHARDLWRLRRAVWGAKDDTWGLWGALLSLTRTPFMLMLIAVGWAVLAVWILILLAVLTLS
jgi:hypothetical protein